MSHPWPRCSALSWLQSIQWLFCPPSPSWVLSSITWLFFLQWHWRILGSKSITRLRGSVDILKIHGAFTTGAVGGQAITLSGYDWALWIGHGRVRVTNHLQWSGLITYRRGLAVLETVEKDLHYFQLMLLMQARFTEGKWAIVSLPPPSIAFIIII